MYLTHHLTAQGPRWAADGDFLPKGLTLGMLLGMDARGMRTLIEHARGGARAEGELLAPIERHQEVWAAGVTYLRSREARMQESNSADVYDRVYDADRVEVFFKSLGFRVAGPGRPVRVRGDSHWNVPEPELTLVINSHGEIVGYTVGNDVSSRDIEGANPLYLPQAKVYNASAALGPGIQLAGAAHLRALPISLDIERGGANVFSGATNTDQLKRTVEEMSAWLTRELDFDEGVFLMTGTGIVPPDDFTLSPGDTVRIGVGDLSLTNPVT